MKRGLVALACLALLSSAACRSAAPSLPAAPAGPPPESELDPRAVRQLMIDVADTQMAAGPDADWKLAVLQSALLGLDEIVGDGKYLVPVRAAGEARAWNPGPDLTLALPYLALYQRDRDRRATAPTMAAFEKLCATSPEASPGGGPLEALLTGSAPPAEWVSLAALAVGTRSTGQRRHLNCGERLLGVMTSARPLEVAGTTRGNGWALLGLLAVIESLPEDKGGPPAAERTFREVAAELARRQRPDGTWGAADPAGPPDPVNTALAVHALAAGVNRGLLDRATHEPAVRRAWTALARGPRPSDAEGAAAWLLAGAEMFRLTLLEGSREATVVASNPLSQWRFRETAEIPWPALARALGAVPGDPIVAVDARSGRFLPSQLLDENGDAMAEQLLVSLSLLGDESRRIVVRRLARPFRPPTPAARAYGRYVPKPHEDFAWENDRVAFRFFSSGIDVWAKRIREPVIDRWYQRTDIHHDRGEGLDFYGVGPSRGCGGLGLWDGKHLHTSRNFTRWRLIADGPVRVAFELGYEPWGPPDARVTETKRVSLDLGQNLSRIETRFGVAGPSRPLPVAVGVLRRGEGTVVRDEPTTWLSYVEPPKGENGQIGCGVVGAETVALVESDQHYLLVRDHDSSRPFVYYAGAYWSKAPDFRQPDEWAVYLAAFSRRASAPINVAIAPR